MTKDLQGKRNCVTLYEDNDHHIPQHVIGRLVNRQALFKTREKRTEHKRHERTIGTTEPNPVSLPIMEKRYLCF